MCARPAGRPALRASHERVEPAPASIGSFGRSSRKAHWVNTWRSGPPSASAYARAPAESRSPRPGRGLTSSGISTRARAQLTSWSASRSTSVPKTGSCRGSNVRSVSVQAFSGACRHTTRGADAHGLALFARKPAWLGTVQEDHGVERHDEVPILPPIRIGPKSVQPRLP